MVLKRRNDTLFNELSQAQHDAIQTIHYVQGEQRSLDIARVHMTDEESTVRNLTGELSLMESCFNLEKSEADRLQESMDEDRRRYEQRLS